MSNVRRYHRGTTSGTGTPDPPVDHGALGGLADDDHPQYLLRGEYTPGSAGIGNPGIPGEDGVDGDRGPPGSAGPAGPTGQAGADGSPGVRGRDGEDGIDGEPGPIGSPGAAGPQGPVGPRYCVDPDPGEDGLPGPQGPQGPPGSNGAAGTITTVYQFLDPEPPDDPTCYPGPVGAVGPTGATGPQGLQGPPGPAGQDGVDGQDGERGPAGPTGATGAPGGGGGSATTVEVALGAFATTGKFTITDATITGTSKVLCWQAPGPYTGKGTRADEAEMAPVAVLAVEPATGSAVVKWRALGHVAVRPQSYDNDRRGGAVQTAVVAVGQAIDNINSRLNAVVIGRVGGNVKFSYLVF